MTEQLKQDAINIVAFALQTASADEAQQFIADLSATLDGGAEVTIDEAIGSAFGLAIAVAEATPSEKDEEWVTTLRDLYIAIKEEGLFAGIKSFFAARKAAKGK
mgnify:CR=1 FL=1